MATVIAPSQEETVLEVIRLSSEDVLRPQLFGLLNHCSPIKLLSCILDIFLNSFYEEQMQGFFKQFGMVKRLRIARNRKTGKSKHYGYLEFTNPEVAKVVANEMNNYLLFEHNLLIQLVPPEKVHPKLWKGINRTSKPVNFTEITRRRHNKERTLQEHQKMVQAILKRDEKRRKQIKEAGIDYECPSLVGKIQPKAKKIKFTDNEH